jgi:hypothetical protein
MCALCKELKGTQILNERGYFAYGEIVGVNRCALRSGRIRHGQSDTNLEPLWIEI